MQRERALALVDGEHYFPVIKDGLAAMAEQYEVIGAVFLGGTEKIGSQKDLEQLGVPVILEKDLHSALRSAIEKFSPDVAVDLSDEPVVGYYERFEIANVLLDAGVGYRGADFAFAPPKLEETSLPSIGVVGTGKRTGKTAVSAYTARLLKQRYNVCVVTMGRGGPAEPEVLHGEEFELSPEYLVKIAEEELPIQSHPPEVRSTEDECVFHAQVLQGGRQLERRPKLESWHVHLNHLCAQVFQNGGHSIGGERTCEILELATRRKQHNHGELLADIRQLDGLDTAGCGVGKWCDLLHHGNDHLPSIEHVKRAVGCVVRVEPLFPRRTEVDRIGASTSRVSDVMEPCGRSSSIFPLL